MKEPKKYQTAPDGRGKPFLIWLWAAHRKLKKLGTYSRFRASK